QATFVVLVRRAASIQRRDSLASWLHGVAYRIARKARARPARFASALGSVPDDVPDPVATLTWRELQTALDAEVQCLPDSLRQPLVLCYLEGRTRDEAAQQLGWTLGTLKGRLERGRIMLRSRLVRRGLTLAAALCATELSHGASLAALSAPSVGPIVHAAG